MSGAGVFDDGISDDGVITSYGIGEYAASEAHVLSVRCDTPLNSTVRGLMWSHPGTHNARVDAVTTHRYIADSFAEVGYVVLATDMGGPSPWGNNAARDRAIDTASYLRIRGASSESLVAAGASLGTPAALYWALNHPFDVAAVALIVPTVDINDIYVNNRAGLAARIAAAWGSASAWEAAEPTRNPINYAADLTFPIGIWYAPDDPVCVRASIEAFAAAHGRTTLFSMGDVGHTMPPTALTQMAEWLAEVAPP
jgi:hypothetical protein